MSEEGLRILAAHPWLIRRLELTTERRDQGWTSVIRLELLSQSEPMKLARATFEHVVDLKITQPPSNMAVSLQIADIGDRGWEDLRYRISDTALHSIEFYCSEVEATWES
jgi:hypothetical protein